MERSSTSMLLLLAGLLSAAGAGIAGDVHLGAHGGISIPNLRGGSDNLFSKGFASRQGPYFGLTADFEMARRLSLDIDLNYTSQGGLRRGLQPITMELPPGLPIPPGTILYADFRNETILDYIEVPVLARYTFGDKVRFFLDAGPYVGFLVRAKAVTEGASAIYLDEAGMMPVIIPPATDPAEYDFGAETDVKDSLETMNFGVAGGCGAIFPLGAGDIVLEARFQLGLRTIQQRPETDGATQTGAVVISVGYRLPLARHQ
jgi:hypothetical protein